MRYIVLCLALVMSMSAHAQSNVITYNPSIECQGTGCRYPGELSIEVKVYARTITEAIQRFEQLTADIKGFGYMKGNNGSGGSSSGASWSVNITGAPPPPLSADEIEKLRRMIK